MLIKDVDRGRGSVFVNRAGEGWKIVCTGLTGTASIVEVLSNPKKEWPLSGYSKEQREALVEWMGTFWEQKVDTYLLAGGIVSKGTLRFFTDFTKFKADTPNEPFMKMGVDKITSTEGIDLEGVNWREQLYVAAPGLSSQISSYYFDRKWHLRLPQEPLKGGFIDGVVNGISEYLSTEIATSGVADLIAWRTAVYQRFVDHAEGRISDRS